ncbi:PREDICTED: uncharacterized protein LOC105566005 isoform X2 [Vollenhovia emeryi]|uniref:uncharacterized protein LOC105566005 isoform X2 n=1 Tax=Vollenhovia emeryi TaxID=411798 RepID=UPI0005F3EE4F|nr:PREDICTED: uncharacterized protein LOC105566005 isoform X2 [Vollenhovia emeryi]
MAVFSLLGLVFFGVTGLFFYLNAYTQLAVQIAALTLCLLVALFFLIDITMVLAFWKRRCSSCKRCCSNCTAELLHKDEERAAPETKIMRHDATTSLSDIKIPRKLEDVASTDHGYRKVSYPRRREYVDCSTCVPSLCNLDVAQIQTEPKKVSVVESQTPRAVTQETPMQTISKCEFCQQHIQLPLVEGAGVASAPCFQHSSQWSYPAIVQFVRGGVGMPCCSGCNCEPGAPQQQPRKLTQQRAESSKVKPSPSKTLTSETTQQVASTECGNVTRLTTKPITTYTVASFYGPDKRIRTVPDMIYKRKMDATKMKDAKPTGEDVDRKLAEETIMKIVRTKRPETAEERVKKRKNDEDNAEGFEERTRISEVKRSEGGGDHCARIYQDLMRAEQGSLTNLEESSMHVSGTLITPPSGRTKPRTLLHLKLNKVDPIEDANVLEEDRTLDKVAQRTAPDNQTEQENEHPTRTGSPDPVTELQLNEACSLCRQQMLRRLQGQKGEVLL